MGKGSFLFFLFLNGNISLIGNEAVQKGYIDNKKATTQKDEAYVQCPIPKQ